MHAQRGTATGGQPEDGHPQAKERDLRRNHPCRHLDPGLAASRSATSEFLLWKPPSRGFSITVTERTSTLGCHSWRGRRQGESGGDFSPDGCLLFKHHGPVPTFFPSPLPPFNPIQKFWAGGRKSCEFRPMYQVDTCALSLTDTAVWGRCFASLARHFLQQDRRPTRARHSPLCV